MIDLSCWIMELMMKGISYVVLHHIVEDYGISKYASVIATLLKNPTLILPQ